MTSQTKVFAHARRIVVWLLLLLLKWNELMWMK